MLCPVILSSLLPSKGVAAGRVPMEVSHFLTAATLVALPKIKPKAPHVLPITIGEVLRWLTSWQVSLLKHRAVDFFLPCQFGIDCPNGFEKRPLRG